MEWEKKCGDVGGSGQVRVQVKAATAEHVVRFSDLPGTVIGCTRDNEVKRLET